MAKPKLKPRDAIARKLTALMAESADLKTQAALAKRTGIAQSTIGRILNGQVNATSEILGKIAEAFGVTVGSLYGEGKANSEPHLRRPGIPLITRDSPNVVNGPALHREVPLISWVQAGSFCETVDNFEPGDAEDWFPSPKRCGPHTFALRVRGVSMEPKYQDGDIIFVDPDAPATNGRDVVVRMHAENEVTFKRLVVEGNSRVLRPLNPEWPGPKLIPINGDTTICGVVIGKWVEV